MTATTYQEITLPASAGTIKLDSAKYVINGRRARSAVVTCRTGAVNYSFDSTVDLSTNGHMLTAGLTIEIGDVDNINLQASADATLFITYYNDLDFTAVS